MNNNISIGSLSEDAIENVIQAMLPSTTVRDNDVSEEIEVDVTIVVDGSVADDVGDGLNEVTDVFNNQGFGVETDVAIVTASPTTSPTFTTLSPSPKPSINQQL